MSLNRDKYRSSGDSRRRRDSRSPPRHRSSRRSPSPGPSRGRTSPQPPRDPRNLPEAFGRPETAIRADDDLNILQRMRTAYKDSPLEDLSHCVDEKRKVKVWTRNYKEVRGVMTGYLLAFDKHWNLVLRDIDEVFLQPKKVKIPFLREVGLNENLPDIPAKVPKEKKGESAPVQKEATEKSGEKKKKRRKKAKSSSERRHVDKLFIRGDNVVMVCPIDEDGTATEEEENEEDDHNSGGD